MSEVSEVGLRLYALQCADGDIEAAERILEWLKEPQKSPARVREALTEACQWLDDPRLKTLEDVRYEVRGRILSALRDLP